MKKTYIIIAVLFAFIASGYSQSNTKIGAGYYGHMGTHPGIVLELEKEQMFTEKASIPVRINLGFYSHKRNHNALFLDINYGFRQYFKSGIFLEESVGFGALASTLNSDGTYEVDESGMAYEVSSLNQPDLMASIILGIGYNLSKNSDQKNLIWLRPKLTWQFPHKLSSLYTPTIQIGFTHQIK